MTIDFGSLLTAEQKRSLLEQRIAQFASEGYQYQLNLATAKNVGDLDLQAKLEKAIEEVSAAIESHQAELKKLPDSE
jgi:hypothetical protein